MDQIIGRLYPAFGLLLLISAVGIGGSLILRGAPIPELTLQNLHPDNVPIFPLLFLTISCGALSGFHATQSPIISRITQRESQGRAIFYGMMITEAVIAMIWAAAAMSLFDGQSLNALLKASGPAAVVSQVATTTLGAVGGTLAIIGVIVLPITSGDTAFRSARMIIADYLNIGQQHISKRLMIALPMFVIAAVLTQVDFNILWRYFSWANQSTAMIALWVGAVYLTLSRKNFWVALLPAMFMTAVTFTYILNAPIGFGLARTLSIAGSLVITAAFTAAFFAGTRRQLAGSGPAVVPVDEPAGPVRVPTAAAGD
ncbi:carbon starvation CstA family protein [Deinococcus sp. Marseille-Q6407]|uniref:carbon starvation CstA family protein n=1 Tax=Deinococcus sp. Marseille-Q6407 TaxID=2969223 RepID=UPI0021BE896D|nr:carbon starvation CstA 5TM domain-containing protein [Deinococcus sp. Marseille-Q6407]